MRRQVFFDVSELRAGQLRNARVELGLVVPHGVVVGGLAFWQLSFGPAVVFLLVGQTVFGFYGSSEPPPGAACRSGVLRLPRDPVLRGFGGDSYRAVARYLGEVSKAARL